MFRRFRWTIAAAFLGLGLAIGTFLTSSRSVGENVPPQPRELTSYRDVVKRVLPSVVSMDAKAAKTKRSAPRKKPDNFDRLPPEFQRQWEEQERRAEKDDDDELGFGSGWIWDAKGVIVTSYHVVEGAESVDVTLLDGRKFTSRDIRSDKKTDLSIIRIQPDRPLP